MIYPITIYGNPVLRKKAIEIDKEYPKLQEFIDNMFETMYSSEGVGLAAPQINKSIRLFIIDAEPMSEDFPDVKGFKQVFINPQMYDETGDEWSFNEGCLSVPNIREDVKRKTKFRLKYYDRDWNFHDELFDGVKARIMQHEYDHLEGILFTDRLSPLKRKLIKSKLTAISKNKISINYKFVPNKF